MIPRAPRAGQGDIVLDAMEVVARARTPSARAGAPQPHGDALTQLSAASSKSLKLAELKRRSSSARSPTRTPRPADGAVARAAPAGDPRRRPRNARRAAAPPSPPPTRRRGEDPLKRLRRARGQARGWLRAAVVHGGQVGAQLQEAPQLLGGVGDARARGVRSPAPRWRTTPSTAAVPSCTIQSVMNPGDGLRRARARGRVALAV